MTDPLHCCPVSGGVRLAALLSYLGGERLGAVGVPDPWLLAAVALVWFAVFASAFAVVRSINARIAAAAHVGT